jgi:putative ABC transport system permease protein
MSIWRLIFREFAYRKLTALVALVSVAVATACLLGSLVVLRAHSSQTQAILADMQAGTEATLAEMQAETTARTKQLEEDYRKIALELGFNVFILPKGAKVADAYDENFGQAEMPESYADKLAHAGVITINHLLPSLSKRVHWPQQDMKIVLTGVHGEVAEGGKRRNKPLMQPVGPGDAVLGYAVARQAKLKTGDQIDLLGRKLKVSEVHPFRGTSDDVTVWIELAEAQRLLEKPGRINAIQAINCLAERCHPDSTGIPAVNEEIQRVLPDTQVLIDMGKAKTRIDSRTRAAEEAKQAMEAERQRRTVLMEKEDERQAAIHGQIAQVTSVLDPVAIVAAGVWVALVMLGNVRQRSVEIGVLRALGVQGKQIMLLFLGKALVVGLLGAIVGCALGIGVAIAWCRAWEAELPIASLVDPATLGAIMAAAPLLAVLASWPPALLAAGQDPAAVLREE